jgi:hypothetical protein
MVPAGEGCEELWTGPFGVYYNYLTPDGNTCNTGGGGGET